MAVLSRHFQGSECAVFAEATAEAAGTLFSECHLYPADLGRMPHEDALQQRGGSTICCTTVEAAVLFTESVPSYFWCDRPADCACSMPHSMLHLCCRPSCPNKGLRP